MKKFFGILWILVMVVALYAFIEQNIVKDRASRSPSVSVAENPPRAQDMEPAKINTPGPLRATSTRSASSGIPAPTSDRIVVLTNRERTGVGLPALGENTLLDRAALAKARDMIAKQYFEHVSPDGKSASDFASAEHYEFFMIGENLAMGGFENTQSLIDAWMKSPGHRANMLNSKYREMGAAAVYGAFEGRRVLFAVQIFGTPASLCPRPDTALKADIDTVNDDLVTRKNILDTMYQEMNTLSRDESYNRQVAKYNTLVAEYNALVAQAKDMISRYNDQVRQFTECVDMIR